MGGLVALVDCNNFYASCERLFQPALIGLPVVVLSNNDGCCIARSEEAKALGIKMGDAYHLESSRRRRLPRWVGERVFAKRKGAGFPLPESLAGDSGKNDSSKMAASERLRAQAVGYPPAQRFR